MPANLYFRASAECRLIKLQGEVFAKISTALRSAAPSRTGTEKITKAKKIPKDVAEVLENCGIKATRESSTASHARVPETVIH